MSVVLTPPEPPVAVSPGSASGVLSPAPTRATARRRRAPAVPHAVSARFALVERAVAVVALTLLTGGPIPLMFIMANRWTGENDGRMHLWVWALGAWLGVVCSFPPPTVLVGLRRTGPLFVFAGWALLSRFWSVDPWVSSLRAFCLAICAVFGAYLGRRFGRREQVRLFGLGLLGAALLSAYFRAFVHLPSSTTIFSGGWQGIYVHSNYLGAVAALGLVTSVLCVAMPGRGRWLWLGPVALHALLLRRSVAAAGEFNAAFALLIAGVVWLYLAVRRRDERWIGLLGGVGGLVVVGLAAVAFQTQQVAERLQRSGDWSNRISLWKAIWPWLLDHPVEGFGYAAMWTYKGGWAKQIELAWGKNTGIPHAHNGFVDAWLGTGILGFGALLVVFGVAFGRAALDLYRSRTVVGTWPVVLWFLILLSSLTESVMLQPPSVQLVMLGTILGGGTAGRTPAPRRRPRHEGRVGPGPEPNDSAVLVPLPAVPER